MKTISTLIVCILFIKAAKADNNLAITSISVISNSTLNGVSNKNTVALNWTAKNSAGASRFEIERSFYSNYFFTISTLQIAFANNNSFSINDNAAELAGRKVAYYRIKQIGADGTISYSNTSVVYLTYTASAASENNTIINFAADKNENVQISVLNTVGKTVAVQNNFVTKGNNDLFITTAGLTKGIYTAAINVNGVAVSIQKIIVE
jgi:hypothetical protein